MDDADFGKRIKRLREERRWTQPFLAELLKVSTKTISNWERGRHNPRSSMGALSAVFEVDLSAEEEGQRSGADPVEAALAASELLSWRRDEVRSVYRRNLMEQRASGEPAPRAG